MEDQMLKNVRFKVQKECCVRLFFGYDIVVIYLEVVVICEKLKVF